MSEIPNFVPSIDMVEGNKDKNVNIHVTNLADIKIDKPVNCSVDSMACTGAECINNIKN